MTSAKSKFLIIFFLSVLITSYELRVTSYGLFAQDAKEEEAFFVAKKAFGDGFYEVSLGLLERFLKNYPDSEKKSEANLLIGQCYFHQNRFLEALTKFEELQNQPQAKDIKDAVLYWIAGVHFKGNNFDKAISYYKMILDEFPKSVYSVHAYNSLGWCLFQERAFERALEYFKSVEEKFPKDPLAQDASFEIIECLYNLKDYAGLKNRIKSYLKSYPKDTAKIPYLYFYSAEADYYLDNFTEAIDGYSRVITSTNDGRMQALSKLGVGWANLKLKQYKEAESAFSQVKTDNLEKKSQCILLFGRAILRFETGQFEEAKNIYGELLGTASEPVILIQACLGEADAFYSMGKYKEAIDAYKQGLVKVKEEPVPGEFVDKLHYGLAWSYLKEGEFKGAIDEFQKVARHTEDKTVKVSALCQMGDTYQDSGDYDKAAQVYDSILKEHPDSLYSDYVQYQLGLTLLKSSNYDGAILAFKNLRNQFPESKLLGDAAYSLGLAYFQREDYNSSREVFEEFSEKFKDSSLRPRAMYLLGTTFYNLGKFNEAIDAFKNILRIYGQDTELCQKAEYEIADSLYQMGNEKEAMDRFKVLRSKYPDSSLTPEVIWWLGEYYYRHNDLNLARRYFFSLIQDFPKSNLIADAYYVLGLTYEEESRYEEGVGNFNKVIELGKSDLAGQAAVAIADIRLKEDKVDLALTMYKDAVKEYPNLDNLIYPKIADAYRKLGNYAQALDFYRKSLEVVPVRQMADIQFKLAEAREAQGMMPEAIEEYLKVNYLYSQNQVLAVKSLLRVAAIYEEKEDFKEAVNVYKNIASMNAEEAKYAQERMDWIKTHVK